ncbi:MAG: metalloprotease PmbA [Legionellales bacterium]|jgi:PmbA protein
MQLEVENLKHLTQDALKQAQALGATSAQVSAQKSAGYEVKVRLGEVDTISFNRDQGIDIEVYKGQRKGIASTSDLSVLSIESAVKIACDMANVTQEDSFAGLADARYMAKDYPDLDLYHPWNLEVVDAITLAKTCEAAALNYDKRISNSDGASLSTRTSCSVYTNSHGFMGSYLSSRHGLSCVAIAKQQDMQRDYWYTTSRNAALLQNAKTVGEIAAQRTIEKLNAKRVKTGQYPIIFAAEIASTLWGHLLAAISGDSLYRNASFLCDHLQQKIFPDFIHIHENPHIKGAIGSAPFDGEGLATRAQDFVRNGILTSYILDSYAARKLNLTPTGNASGVHNLTIASSDLNLAALFKKMGTGLYVTELMGQGVNILTGDYSRGVTGFWIENGEIQYPVHEITIAGNLRDMFANIQTVANDVDTRMNILTGSVLLGKMMVAGE